MSGILSQAYRARILRDPSSWGMVVVIVAALVAIVVIVIWSEKR